MKYLKLIFHPIVIIFFIVYLVLFFGIGRKLYENLGVKASHGRDLEMVSETEKKYKVSVDPEFNYSYAIMRKGVLQHLDRDYTYDVIPRNLIGGTLFQGKHRPPKGTVVQIRLFQPATVYFFFHHSADGGYSKIFPGLKGWKKCKNAPKYDIHNGTHGLHMRMYKMTAEEGVYLIPPTLQDKACFSIVFKPVYRTDMSFN